MLSPFQISLTLVSSVVSDPHNKPLTHLPMTSPLYTHRHTQTHTCLAAPQDSRAAAVLRKGLHPPPWEEETQPQAPAVATVSEIYMIPGGFSEGHSQCGGGRRAWNLLAEGPTVSLQNATVKLLPPANTHCLPATTGQISCPDT